MSQLVIDILAVYGAGVLWSTLILICFLMYISRRSDKE